MDLGKTGMWILVFALLAAGGVFLAAPPAFALHDQGYACSDCHILNPTLHRPGTNSIRQDQPVLATIPTKPSFTTWQGGNPIPCDFCHRSATDVPLANFNKTGVRSRHPVDLISSGDNTTNPREIVCNDCHNGDDNGNAIRDLTPPSLLARSPRQGYPDHDNAVPGYSHTLTANPPHLTRPYWPTVPAGGVSNTAFWTNVRLGTQDMACWGCHDGVSQSPFTQVTATSNVKAQYTASDNTAGHRIRTTGITGALGAGAALPCYDCHDSHGSVNNALILDSASIEGTSSLAITTYNQAARPYNDKVLCAGCHDTNQAGTTAGTRVEGLNPVDPFNSTLWGSLHVNAGVAAAMASSTTNCLSSNGGCHGSPHNPTGESAGNQNCSACHSGIFNGMSSGTASYHHVMANDNASYTTAVPGSSATDTNRRCTMCHVDHNIFRPDLNPGNLKGRAANLRTAIGAVPTAASNFDNTDFLNSGAGGICLSCHTSPLSKNQTNQKAEAGNTSTHVVVSAFPVFNSSAHNYGVVSTFGRDGSRFGGNCSKCHNSDRDVTAYNSLGFGVHDGTSGRLLAQYGRTTASDNLQEGFCYGCHSEAGDLAAAAGGKSTAGRDWYGAAGAAMVLSAEKVWKNFNAAAMQSKHPLTGNGTTTARVECENCHNPHVVTSTTGKVVNPDNTLQTAAYGSVAERAAFCLRCHDGSAPAYANTASSLVPYSVFIAPANAALMNKSTNAARAHWSVSGQLQPTTVKGCGDCHDNHGSTTKKLLGLYDAATGTSRIGTTALYSTATPTAQDNAAVCGACHGTAGQGYPAATVTLSSIDAYEGYRDGTGYFSPTPSPTVTTVRWPGYATWDNATVNPHRATVKAGPAALGGRPVADCNGCHDPHGTPYTYNMLTDNMVSTNFRLCFDCHDGTVGATNIRQYYPTSVGGSGSFTDNNHGHKVVTSGGRLAAGSPLPCYDCHVTHGSKNGNTQLKSDQRWSNLGDTKANAANSRAFCLGCHVTTDNRDGAGTTLTASNAANLVEGLPRLPSAGTNRLKLPSTVAEHVYIASPTASQACFTCHYSATPYGTDPNANNAHNPGAGGGPCDLCHDQSSTHPTAPKVLWKNGNRPGGPSTGGSWSGNSLYGSHLVASTTETLSTATQWAAQCNKCHTTHSGSVQVLLPPSSWADPAGMLPAGTNMQARLGIDYAGHNGIYLGGTSTSGATEAEICWNCHGTNDAINEWGYNADTNGATFPVVQIPDVNNATAGSYNYGYLYTDNNFTTLTPDWTGTNGRGAFRKDGYQHDSTRLSKQIASIHSVDFAYASANPSIASSVQANLNTADNTVRRGTGTTLEPKGNIRCSYCHDVHDLNRASNPFGAGKETWTGRPFLRGSWFGSPYPPDMPPRTGYTYPTTGGTRNLGNRYVTGMTAGMPRVYADVNSRNRGGYFIDLNSGNPTASSPYNALDNTAGLCTLCHGGSVAGDVDKMNFYAASLWRADQVNGHSNAVQGGTGSNKRDLFNANRGTQPYMASQNGVLVYRFGQNINTLPWRNLLNGGKPCDTTSTLETTTCPPRNTGWYGGTAESVVKDATGYRDWYHQTGFVTPTKPHNFPCSKCHSPHATGLPALLLTNCLDVGHSDWTANTNRVGPNVATAAYANAANNCHRKKGTERGWNRLAPRQ